MQGGYAHPLFRRAAAGCHRDDTLARAAIRAGLPCVFPPPAGRTGATGSVDVRLLPKGAPDREWLPRSGLCGATVGMTGQWSAQPGRQAAERLGDSAGRVVRGDSCHEVRGTFARLIAFRRARLPESVREAGVIEAARGGPR